MRFAFMNGRRVEPQPGLHGECPGCREAVIAKCGKFVGWHWAHKASTHCDKWWEPETAWHRRWKDRFPTDWQEVPLRDPASGELHIADVRTPEGLVLEFQRSTIKPEEVRARETFYRNMVWVVDGCRSDFDRFNFSNGLARLDAQGVAQFRWIGRGSLLSKWHTTIPVFIDFGDHGFWRIIRYDPAVKSGLALAVNPDAFASHVSSGTANFLQGGGPASPLQGEH